MQFCPKCGAILILKKKNYGCPRCTYATKDKIEMKTSEKIEEQQAIGVVKEKDADTLPIVKEKCKKCGHEKAAFWTVQTRAGDEAETKFFKCTKCQHTWREYR